METPEAIWRMPRLDILEEDEVARAWAARRTKAEMAGVIQISLILGPLLGLLAIFGVSRVGDGELPWKFVISALFIPLSVGGIIWFTTHLTCISQNRWELSAEGIKIRGFDRMNIRWSQVEELKFREITELPGYTRVVLRSKSRFGVIRPAIATIVVKASEVELRTLLIESRE